MVVESRVDILKGLIHSRLKTSFESPKNHTLSDDMII